ncbi:MAG TPA: CBS domain-containing protein [Solirubrobacteraceae bacterium]
MSTRTLSVGDVMHHGVISTPPQTPLIEVAAQMAEHRVHSVVVDGLARGRDEQETLIWGLITDLDLMKALAGERLHVSAGELAASEIITVETTDTIDDVARLMAEHECTHLVVISPRSGEPLGVISSLDIAEGLMRAQESLPVS